MRRKKKYSAKNKPRKQKPVKTPCLVQLGV